MSNATADEHTDPSQVVAPYVPSGMEWNGFKVRNLKYGTPGALVILLGGLLWLFRLPGGIPIAAVGGAIALVGIGLAVNSDEHTTAYDRMKAPLEHAMNTRSLPLTADEAAAAPIHGVQRIHSDGTAEMQDGRLVALMRVHGRNMDMQHRSKTETLVSTLGQALDERLGGTNFRYWSTTSDFDSERFAEQYWERSFSDSFNSDDWVEMRALLEDVAQFQEVNCESWGTKEWQHYVVVEVKPWEVDDDGVQSQRQAQHSELLNRVKKQAIPAHQRLPGVTPYHVGPVEHASILAEYWAGVSHEFGAETVSKDTNLAVWPHPTPNADDETREQPRPEAVEEDSEVGRTGVAAPQQVTTAGDGGTQAQQTVAGTTEATDDPTDVLDDEDASDASYLAQVRESLLAPLGLSENDEAVSAGEAGTPIQDLLAPSVYDDEGEGYVEVGEQYCRTYWVGSWPVRPDGLFLERLYNLRGIDLDVCIRAKSRETDPTIDEIEQQVGAMDADISEMRDRSDLGARSVVTDAEAYEQMYDLLQEGRTHAWDMVGYVTVRAGTREALDKAEDIVQNRQQGRNDVDVGVVKERVLYENAETVVDAMEDAPANLVAKTSDHRQGDLFESASPNGRDAYADVSIRKRESLALTGSLAAAFPFCSTSIRQDDGVSHGWNMQNGELIHADPYKQGKAPHKITVGDSGAGKSTYVLIQALRWWAQEDDRTLIMCDTFGDFAGITELTNGEHIVVGGRQTINPLHIEETPPEVLRALDVDPYKMKSDEIIQFLTGLLKAQGVDPGEYVALIKDAIRETYADFDIYPVDVESHGNEPKPTMEDFLEKIREMSNNPDEYVLGGSESEKEELQRNAGRLLRKLAGFQEGREYSHFVGEDDADIELGGVTYLDLQQMEGNGAVKHAAMLQMMLGKVYERVKEAPGKTMFVIDEAHYLLHSEEMKQWLQRAARHWRHHDACLWFASQSPKEFVSDDQDDQDDKNTIRGQCATKEFFRTEELDPEVAGKWGLNERQTDFIKNKARTPGTDHNQVPDHEAAQRYADDDEYTQCLINFTSQHGWLRSQVEVSDTELDVLDFTPGEDGDFQEFFWERRNGAQPTGGDD